MNDYEHLDRLPVLKDCRPETRARFTRLGKILSYPKGHLCLRAREDNANIFFILDGKVQIYNLTRSGRKKILFVLGRNNIANENISGRHSTVYCETIGRCSFYVIRRELLLSLMEQDFRLTRTILEYQERKIWRLGHQLKNTAGSIYLERKLASKLWKLARDFGIPTEKGILIDLPLSVTFLADLLGAPRENASRACRKLTEAGLIRMDGKRIYIPSPERISEFYRNQTLSS